MEDTVEWLVWVLQSECLSVVYFEMVGKADNLDIVLVEPTLFMLSFCFFVMEVLGSQVLECYFLLARFRCHLIDVECPYFFYTI